MTPDPNDTTPDAVPTTDDGTPMLTGCLQPDVLRFAAAPAWDEANEVLPESQWEEHDDLAQFNSEIRAQKNNNCTNASLSALHEALCRSCGVEPPEGGFSWSWLYSRNNGGRDQGAFCRDLADELRKVGNCPRALWPDDKIYAPRGGFSPEIMTAAGEWMALEIYQCLDFSHVASALSRRFFVYHGFVMGNGYTRTGKDGKVPEWDGKYSSGHAMFSRGLTRRFGDWRTITPNTWGTSWGDRGVGYWPKSYFWPQEGRYVNLDAFAVRAVRRNGRDVLPVAK